MSEQTAPSAAHPAWRAWLGKLWQRRALRTALILFVIMRVVTGVVAVVGIDPADPPNAPFYQLDQDPAADRATDTYGGVFPADGLLRGLTWPWFVWDTHYYVGIASAGYDLHPRAPAFPPLYPALVAVGGGVLGDYVLGAILVSNIACFIMLYLLLVLVEDETGDDRIARWTAIWLLAFPTAYYFFAPYTESLYLALTLGAWLAARRRRYWLSGALACLAALTRTQGLILLVPLGYIALRESGLWANNRLRLDHWPVKLRALLRATPAVAGAPLGWALYFAGMVWAGYGTPSSVMTREWFIQTQWPWQAFLGNIQLYLTISTPDLMDTVNLLALVSAALLIIPMVRRLPAEYTLYTLATLGVISMRLPVVRPFAATVRYMVTIFPLFMMAALLLAPKRTESRARRLVRVALLESFVIFQVVLLAKYVRWTFIA